MHKYIKHFLCHNEATLGRLWHVYDWGWTANLDVPGSGTTWHTTGIFSLQGTHSALIQALRRRVTFVSFRGDIKPSVLGDLV